MNISPKVSEDNPDYVSFGDVARQRCDQQCQYACRYVQAEWQGEYPNLGDGLRFLKLDSSNYHAIQIHKDDVEEFVRRYINHQKNNNPMYQFLNK